MLDRQGTITWLTEHGVTVLGAQRDYCTGYIFAGEKVRLQGVYEGKKAEREGKYYHPAVNGRIDELTEGYSSKIQLKALLANIQLAKKL